MKRSSLIPIQKLGISDSDSLWMVFVMDRFYCTCLTSLAKRSLHYHDRAAVTRYPDDY